MGEKAESVSRWPWTVLLPLALRPGKLVCLQAWIGVMVVGKRERGTWRSSSEERIKCWLSKASVGKEWFGRNSVDAWVWVTESIGSPNRPKRQKGELFCKEESLRSLRHTSGHVQVTDTSGRLQLQDWSWKGSTRATELEVLEESSWLKEGMGEFSGSGQRGLKRGLRTGLWSKRGNFSGYACSSDPATTLWILAGKIPQFLSLTA